MIELIAFVILSVITTVLIGQNLYYKEIIKESKSNNCSLYKILLKKAVHYIEEYLDPSDENGTPFHDCELIENPAKGYCQFHDWYWEAKTALGEINGL